MPSIGRTGLRSGLRLTTDPNEARQLVDAAFARARELHIAEELQSIPLLLRTATAAQVEKDFDAARDKARDARQVRGEQVRKLLDAMTKEQKRLAAAQSKVAAAREKANALLAAPLDELNGASQAVNAVDHQLRQLRTQRDAFTPAEIAIVRQMLIDLEATLRTKAMAGDADQAERLGALASLHVVQGETSEVLAHMFGDRDALPMDLSAWLAELLVRVSAAGTDAEERERRRTVFEYESKKRVPAGV